MAENLPEEECPDPVEEDTEVATPDAEGASHGIGDIVPEDAVDASDEDSPNPEDV